MNGQRRGLRLRCISLAGNLCSDLRVESFVIGPLATNSYLFAIEESAMAIDPGPESCDLLMAAADKFGATIEIIVNTHGHWDHTYDNHVLMQKTGAPLLIQALDSSLIEFPEQSVLSTARNPIDVQHPSTPNRTVDTGDNIELGKLSFQVLHTPGHTVGGICLISDEARVLISGDTLFLGAYGRVDLPGGNIDDMVRTLKSLANLNPELNVYPGHGPPTRLVDELSWMRSL